MEILLVKEDVEPGDTLALNANGDVVKHRPEPRIIGVAARKIRVGEAIAYVRNGNTDDVEVKWEVG